MRFRTARRRIDVFTCQFGRPTMLRLINPWRSSTPGIRMDGLTGFQRREFSSPTAGRQVQPVPFRGFQGRIRKPYAGLLERPWPGRAAGRYNVAKTSHR
jgi:hypothetical protein